MTYERHILADPQTVKIILVEDDYGHAKLIERNLRKAGLTNEITHLDDGIKGANYIIEEANKEHNGTMLVLLDLNLPGLDGGQVLKIIREHKNSKKIPVIMLTTTDNSEEISKCYELGCNIYVTKPVEYEEFAQAIKNLGFFLSIVKLPENDLNAEG